MHYLMMSFLVAPADRKGEWFSGRQLNLETYLADINISIGCFNHLILRRIGTFN